MPDEPPRPIHPDDPALAALAGEGRVVCYFGYGSLVNPRTLRTKFLAIRRARVQGWRRTWVRRAAPNMALLSVRPDEGEAIVDGVVVYDHADHLPAVDEREAGYGRRLVPPDRLAIAGHAAADAPVYIYEASPVEPDASEIGATILQSYLDAVLQGFRLLYGEEGVRRFVHDTEGFETVVLRDRAAPRYPRAVAVEPAEASFYDRLVLDRGARFVDAG